MSGMQGARRACRAWGPLSESELPCASGVRAVRRRLVRLRHGVLSAHGATSSRNDAGVGRPARRGTVPSTQWVVRAPTEGEEAASSTRSSSKGSEGPPCSDVPACSLGAIRAARRREVCSEPLRDVKLAIYSNERVHHSACSCNETTRIVIYICKALF